MPPTPVTFKLNPLYLLLEVVGSVLLAFGAADGFAHANLVPAQFRFANYAWYMMGVGLLLGLPFVFDVIKQAKSSVNK